MGYWLDFGQVLLCVLCSWTSSSVYMDRGEIKGYEHIKKNEASIQPSNDCTSLVGEGFIRWKKNAIFLQDLRVISVCKIAPSSQDTVHPGCLQS